MRLTISEIEKKHKLNLTIQKLLTILDKKIIVIIFKTIIGPYVDGDLYFSRPYLDNRLWKHIQNGSHILISAPRRIGKTSFLRNKSTGYVESYTTFSTTKQSSIPIRITK